MAVVPGLNIAVCVRGDMRDENDPLYQYLRRGGPVKTDDHTETTLVNAVREMLQDPDPPGFAFNRLTSPQCSYLRVDASIWIGMPGAPMGWDADLAGIRQGWHPNKRLGTLKYVGHPAIDPDNPLTPTAAATTFSTHDDERRRGHGDQPGHGEQPQQHPRRKRQRKQKTDDAESPPSKRRRGLCSDQRLDPGQEAVIHEVGFKIEEKEIPDETAPPPIAQLPQLEDFCVASSDNIMPSSLLDPILLHDADGPLFPEM